MKRNLALAGAIVVALTSPGMASSSTQAGSGEPAAPARGTEQDFKISFILVSRGDKPEAIKKFRFEDLATQCDGGATVATSGGIKGKIPVDDQRRFDASAKDNGKKISIAGKVKRGSKVVGTIRAKGDFGGETDCNSGKRRWRAGPS